MKKKLLEGATKIEEVHFRVHFEGLTRLVRDIWAEGRYTAAIELLKSCNIEPEFHEDIIHGKLKMVDLPEGRPGIDGTLVNDNWTVPEGYGEFGYYPKFIDLPNMAERMLMLRRTYEQGAINEARAIIQDYADSINSLEKERLANQFFSFPEYVQEQLEEEFGFTVVRGRFEVRTPSPLPIPSVDEYIKRQIELDKIETVEPDPNFTSKFGIITRDGKFYGCGWMEHEWLCNKLSTNKDDALFKQHWIIISKRAGSTNFDDIYFEFMGRTLTQKQLDTIFEFVLAHGLEMPDELKGIDIE